MGKYSTGILGSFSGKIGTVIGSTWKGIDYMRSLPKRKSAKTTSEVLLKQQLKFALAVKFLKPVVALLELGFKYDSSGKSGYNVAMSHFLKNCIDGTYPDYVIDYTKVQVSEGSLLQAPGVHVSGDLPGIVNITWQDNSDSGNAKADDKVIWMAYCERLKRYLFSTAGAVRSSETESISAPDFTGEEVHIWFALVSADGKLVATSIYAGSAVVV